MWKLRSVAFPVTSLARERVFPRFWRSFLKVVIMSLLDLGPVIFGPKQGLLIYKASTFWPKACNASIVPCQCNCKQEITAYEVMK